QGPPKKPAAGRKPSGRRARSLPMECYRTACAVPLVRRGSPSMQAAGRKPSGRRAKSMTVQCHRTACAVLLARLDVDASFACNPPADEPVDLIAGHCTTSVIALKMTPHGFSSFAGVGHEVGQVTLWTH